MWSPILKPVPGAFALRQPLLGSPPGSPSFRWLPWQWLLAGSLAGAAGVAAAQGATPEATAPTAAAPSAPTPATPVPALTPSTQLRLRPSDDANMPAFSVADSAHTDAEGRAILTGNAEVRRTDAVVKGQRIEYQHETGQIRVRGQGLMMREGNLVRSPAFDYNLESQTGQIEEASFWLGGGGGSGTAERGRIFSRNHMRLTDVNYSACPCPQPDWYITAPRVDFYVDENEGVARGGVLFFKGVPILASPWLSFPLRKERKSGFLLPTYGGSSNSGLEFALPYYFNLAPNYDATLTPRYMVKRGLQLGGQARYLGQRFTSQVDGTYLGKDLNNGQTRWLYHWQHNHRLGSVLEGSLAASFDVQRVSDDDYFRDFTQLGLNEASIDSVSSTARLNWSGNRWWQASVQTTAYQTLQDRTAPGHRRPAFDKLPELYLRGTRHNWRGFDLATNNTVTWFHMPNYKDGVHPYPFPATRYPKQFYDGQRLSSYNSISYPIVRAGWYATPKAALHLSHYRTNWNGFAMGPDAYTGKLPGTPRTQSRTLPLFSLDSGMTFERNTSLFGNAAIQTLEPRLYYLYVPYRDQASIPTFDTGVASFNFAQAFEENLFSGGWDRISNANQLTLGLSTRWLDERSNTERLAVSMAQRLYFDDQKVTLSGGRARLNTKSDYLLGVNAAVTDKLHVALNAQFNPESAKNNRMSVGVRWQPKRLARLALTYRYERDPAQLIDPAIILQPGYVDRSKEQVSLSGQWPLTKKLYAVGRTDYSLQEKRATQTILGLEYKGDCCWAMRAVVQRYAVSVQNVNTAVFLQLELQGLGSLGTDPLSLLSRTIDRYQPITQPAPHTTIFERYE